MRSASHGRSEHEQRDILLEPAGVALASRLVLFAEPIAMLPSARDVMANTPLEIERTYLLTAMPSVPGEAEVWRIEQGYLGDDPVDGGAPDGVKEGRVRRITHPNGEVACYFTIKRGEGLVRTEEERAISEEEFGRLWPRTTGRRLTKTRYRVRHEGFTWEIDRFDDVNLVLAEVELPDAEAVPPVPAWLAPLIARDVTEEPAFRNYRLALAIGRGEPIPR